MSTNLWVHCNKCYTNLNSSKHQFFIAKCGHVLCYVCAEYTGKNKKCIVCQLAVSIIPLSRKTPPDVAMFFQPIDSYLNTMKAIIKFQTENRLRLIKYFTERHHQVKTEYARLLSAYNAVKADCDRMKEYIEMYKRKVKPNPHPLEMSQYSHPRGGGFSDFSGNSSHVFRPEHGMGRNRNQASFSSLMSDPQRCRRDHINNTADMLSISQLYLNGKL